MHHVTSPCPLCRKLGRTVTVLAELDPVPGLMIVRDRQRGERADAFDEFQGQTLEGAWTLIEAALDAGTPVTDVESESAHGRVNVRRPSGHGLEADQDA